MKLFILSLFTVSLIFPVVTQSKKRLPSVKLYKKLPFKHFHLRPLPGDRYVVSTARDHAILDLKTLKTYSFPPLYKMKGIPQRPKYSKKAKYNGKLWNGSIDKTLFFDGKKVIFAYNISRYVNTLNGKTPVCTDLNTHGRGNSNKCFGKARFIAKYQRWYCSSCRKYIKTKNYIKKKNELWLIIFNIKTQRATLKKIEANLKTRVIGIDNSGKYLYFYTYKMKNVKSLPITLKKVEISTLKEVWRYTFNVPIRQKDIYVHKLRSSKYRKKHIYREPYLRMEHSYDFSKIALWEYDEADSKFAGSLKNPSARGYIVDTLKSKHFEFSVPVTMYGHFFDSENKYFIVGSNQTGKIYRLNLKTHKFDRSVFSGKSIFHMAKSKNEVYIFVINKKSINIHKFSTLRKIRTVKFSKFYRGFTSLLVGISAVTVMKNLLVLPAFKRLKKIKYYDKDDKKVQILKLRE